MRNRFAGVMFAAVLVCGCGEAPKKEAARKSAEPAPQTYRVRFDTSKGDFIVEVHRDWAPFGADRFYELTKARFFDNSRFFRVLKGFVVQFGLSGDPDVNSRWTHLYLPDDPVRQGNKRGTITFATSGPGTRTTQVFINLRDNSKLDSQGFAPFGQVIEGMDVVEQFYGGYRDGPPRDSGPDQAKIESQGKQYLEQHYPKLDFVKTARVIESGSPAK